MDFEQTILWTVLPNGRPRAQAGAFSLFVSPRLTPKTARRDRVPLGELPCDFNNWPKAVRGIDFDRAWRLWITGSPTTHQAMQVVSPPPDPALWARLFPPDTPVQAPAPPPSPTTPIHSFSAGRVDRAVTAARLLDLATQTYGVDPKIGAGLALQLARGLAGDDPERVGLRELLALWTRARGASSRPEIDLAMRAAPTGPTLPRWGGRTFRYRLLRARTKIARAKAASSGDEVGAALLERARLTKAERATWDVWRALPGPLRDLVEARSFEDPLTLPRPQLRPLEFHERLSLLGDHPALLRRLGLVIDCELTRLESQAAQVFVHVQPSWTPRAAVTVEPTLRTAAIINDARFYAASGPDGGAIELGYLRLHDPSLFSISQHDLEDSARRFEALTRALFDRVNDGGVDPTREAGDDPDPTRETIEAASARSLGTPPPPRTRGPAVYRERRASALRDRLLRTAALEQALRPGATIDLFAEDLVRGYRVDVRDEGAGGPWRSLCWREGSYVDESGRPLLSLREEGFLLEAVDRREGAIPGEEDAPPLAGLWAHERLFRWDGWSLVTPRPGRPIDPTGAGPASSPEDAPLGVRLQARPPKGSLPRLRYDHTYRFRARTVDLAGNGLPDTHTATFAQSPPLTWRRLEGLGPGPIVPCGDPGPGGGPTRLVIRTYNDVANDPPAATREGSRRYLAPERTSQDVAEAHGCFDPGRDASDDERRRAAEKAWTIIAGREAPLPATLDADGRLELDAYLVDPRSTTITLRAGPGPSPLPDHKSSWTGRFFPKTRWPLARPIELLLTAADEPTATFTASAQRLRIGVPMGRVARYSRVGPADASDAAIQLRELLAPALAPQAGLEARAPAPQLDIDALQAPLAPRGELELVHAVLRPLRDADPSVGAITRAPGETTAELQGAWTLDPGSTAQVELCADWSEPRDAPHTAEGSIVAPRGAVAFRQAIAELHPGTSVPFLAGARQAFGDTRHRRVRLRGRATSRFVDCFPKEQDLTFTRTSAPAQRRGDPWFHVPASARPEAPAIVQVVPSFAREPATGGSTRSARVRGALRVYLRGPWWSSGEGEQLAVVLEAPQSPRPGGALAPRVAALVTWWGADPTHERPTAPGSFDALPSTRPGRAQLVNASSFATVGLPPEDDDPTIEGDPTPALVDVACFPVGRTDAGAPIGWDVAHGLWCCDIELDVGVAYWPMIRLALARYQAHALPGLELSPVVTAQLCPIAPARLATISRLADGRYDVAVTADHADAIRRDEHRHAAPIQKPS
ncbi:MAG: hypothetical protein R3A51_22240 [Nannocystaceae bacterium]